MMITFQAKRRWSLKGKFQHLTVLRGANNGKGSENCHAGSKAAQIVDGIASRGTIRIRKVRGRGDKRGRQSPHIRFQNINISCSGISDSIIIYRTTSLNPTQKLTKYKNGHTVSRCSDD